MQRENALEIVRSSSKNGQNAPTDENGLKLAALLEHPLLYTMHPRLSTILECLRNEYLKYTLPAVVITGILDVIWK